MKKKVAFQGILGSFSSVAATAIFGAEITAVHTKRFRDIFALVSSGEAEFGVVPMENALAGSLQENTDLLREHNCWICSEYYCPVQLALLSKGRQSEIRLVFSHPKAFEQCSSFLESNPQIRAVVWSDTATAAQHVAAQDDPSLAAIAGEQAAAIYSLPVCNRSIQNHQHNATRFIAVSARPIDCPNATKCSIIVKLPHRPGSLSFFLGEIASHELNITKIESRPILGKPFETAFLIDIEKTASSTTELAQVIPVLSTKAQDLRLLGLYNAQQIPRATR